MLSTHFNIADSFNQVYCRKINNFVNNNPTQGQRCLDCDYFRGSLQGRGVECCWDDPQATSYIITIKDPKSELLRVCKLIDSNKVQKE